MTLYTLKPQFQRLLRPLVYRLMVWRITPNAVTLSAIILSIGAGAILALNYMHPQVYLIVPFVLIVRMALNAIDGMLAREYNMQTPVGVILNEMGDIISDVALYLPFALLELLPATLVVVTIVTGLLAEVAGVVAVQAGASRRYDGPMGKSDRAFFFTLVALLIAFGMTGQAAQVAAYVGFVAVALMHVATSFNRVTQALHEVMHSESHQIQ